MIIILMTEGSMTFSSKLLATSSASSIKSKSWVQQLDLLINDYSSTSIIINDYSSTSIISQSIIRIFTRILKLLLQIQSQFWSLGLSSSWSASRPWSWSQELFEIDDLQTPLDQHSISYLQTPSDPHQKGYWK